MLVQKTEDPIPLFYIRDASYPLTMAVCFFLSWLLSADVSATHVETQVLFSSLPDDSGIHFCACTKQYIQTIGTRFQIEFGVILMLLCDLSSESLPCYRAGTRDISEPI